MDCRKWIFHSITCEEKKTGAYTSVFTLLCEGQEKGAADMWLPHTPLKHYIRPQEFILLTLDCSVQWWIALSRSRPIVGSEFSSHSQLLYGPCMSSLTAAVFTSRLDWYGQTSCCPATVSSFPSPAFISPLYYVFGNNMSAWKVLSILTTLKWWQEVPFFCCLPPVAHCWKHRHVCMWCKSERPQFTSEIELVWFHASRNSSIFSWWLA